MLPTDLPSDMPTFLARFGSDQACREHLFKLRWPDGFRCRACGLPKYYAHADRLVYECAACRAHNSLLAGTVFEQTKTSLSKWFLAIFLFSSSKGGIAAAELKRQMGFGSEQTAWTWLHKLRRAMVVPDRQPLSGTVEVDESYVGGPEPGKRGRGAGGKVLVACAVETSTRVVEAPDPERFSGIVRTLSQLLAAKIAKGLVAPRRCLGRARLAVLGDASAKSLEPFVKSAMDGAATVVTDGHSGYLGLARQSIDHERIVLSKTDGPAHEHLPAVHLVFTLLKRLILGTYHGAVSSRHFQHYLDEYVFRFNRKSAAQGARVGRLVALAVTTLPVRNWMILGYAQRPS